MRTMIQVKRNGEWVDYMPVIGIRQHLAAEDVRQKTRLPARVKPRDEDLPRIS